jgi:hypothetical protein
MKALVFNSGQGSLAGIGDNDFLVKGLLSNGKIPFAVQAKPLVPSEIRAGILASWNSCHRSLLKSLIVLGKKNF